MIDESDGNIDLLITDGIMPKLTGFALARALQEEKPDFPILCITGCEESILTQEQKQNSQLVVIRKPFPVPELLNEIQKKIGGSP